MFYQKFISLVDQSKNQQKTIEQLQQQITDISIGKSASETAGFKLDNINFSCSKAIATNIGALRKSW